MANYLITWLFSNRRDQGQDLAEYALLIGLLALVVLLSLTILGEEVSSIFSAIANNVMAWPATYGW
jgi:Flp pilus assembly pilin Flp